MASDWTGRGKVRAREIAGGAEIAIEGVTTQARYYKPLVYEFFRKEFAIRPRYGEFEVEQRNHRVKGDRPSDRRVSVGDSTQRHHGYCIQTTAGPPNSLTMNLH